MKQDHQDDRHNSAHTGAPVARMSFNRNSGARSPELRRRQLSEGKTPHNTKTPSPTLTEASPAAKGAATERATSTNPKKMRSFLPSQARTSTSTTTRSSTTGWTTLVELRTNDSPAAMARGGKSSTKGSNSHEKTRGRWGLGCAGSPWISGPQRRRRPMYGEELANGVDGGRRMSARRTSGDQASLVLVLPRANDEGVSTRGKGERR